MHGKFRDDVHLFILNRHTPSGRSRVYRVAQLRTNGVHCRESAGTGPVNLKVVPNECCLGRSLYQLGSHRKKVTQDFSSTFLLRRVP